MSINPLQKYFRQPKLFVSLPSKGLYYGPGDIQGDSNNVPVFAMTGMDEILMKTPDALFNGESTVKVIQSCCPYIVNAKAIPSLDIDTLLVAIRLATYGDQLGVNHTCRACGTENDFDVDLKTVIDHYANINFDGKLEHLDLIINLKPLSYQQLTDFNVENFKLERMLAQLTGTELAEEEKTKYIEQIYEKMADIQLKVLIESIESIRTPEVEIVDNGQIIEFLKNIDSTFYNAIKTKLEKNKELWSMPAQKVKCASCEAEDSVTVVLDQSNFFVSS
jgi:hypothetical protein